MKTKGFGIPKMHFFSGYPGILFRGLLRSRIPGSLELPEISFREGGGFISSTPESLELPEISFREGGGVISSLK
jgi:hypothetical protein